MIPPQMHFNEPNPKIDFANVIIPISTMPWPKMESNVRRAAINTFGAGGTNGHAVIESFPQVLSESTASSERPLLFKASAADEPSLRKLCERYADYVEQMKPNIYDLAYTLLCRRSTLRKSICFTASTLDEVISKLTPISQHVQLKDSEDGKGTLFLFTGQGAQWSVSLFTSQILPFCSIRTAGYVSNYQLRIDRSQFACGSWFFWVPTINPYSNYTNADELACL